MKNVNAPLAAFKKNAVNIIVLLAAGLSTTVLAAEPNNQHQINQQKTAISTSVTLPLVIGWFNGQPVDYIQTEASDKAVAAQQGVNYVPLLANAANTKAVDDIYLVTNNNQGNVIASAPNPTGPDNTDPSYSPLWQVSTVTWNAGTTPTTLTSEAAIKNAEADGKVVISRTKIIVNCPVIFTQNGGLLPNAKISIGHQDEEEGI